MKQILILFFLTAVSITSAIAQTKTDFLLETIKVRAGEKATGFIEVPKGIDDGTQIPVSVFHGAKDGKILLVIAGVHGSEYSPVLALQNLVKQINPQELAGTVILVQVANPPSFFRRTIYESVDGKNLNRSFPGKADGTITERIAFTLTEKLMRRADYIIDVHCGDNNESLRPYTGFTQNADSTKEFIETSTRMSRAMGIDLIKVATGRATDFKNAGYSTNVGTLLGKPTIAVESGELGIPQKADINRIETGLLNVMRELGMLSGKVLRFKKQAFITRSQTLISETDGLFYSLVRRDQKVKKDEPLGYVTDFFGKRQQEIRAPFDGVVMYFTATPPVSKGDPLVNIGELKNQKKN